MIFPKVQKQSKAYDWFKATRLLPTHYRGYFIKEDSAVSDLRPSPEFCHICEETDTIRYYAINSQPVILCDDCIAVAESRVAVATENSASATSYGVAFLGAMAFAILGIVAWTYVGVFLTKFTTPLVVLLAYLVYKGYHNFNGKSGKKGAYTILAAIMLSIALASLTTMLVELMHHGYSFSDSLMAWAKGNGVFQLWFNETFIAFVLGLVVWLWMSSESKEKVAHIDNTAELAAID